LLWVGNPANPHRDASLGVVKVEDRVRLLFQGPVFDRVLRGDRVPRRGARTARGPRCIRDDEVEVTGGSAHRVPASVPDLPTLAQDFPRDLPVGYHAYLLLAYLRVRAGAVIPRYGGRTSLYSETDRSIRRGAIGENAANNGKGPRRVRYRPFRGTDLVVDSIERLPVSIL
jgi:hypothetical protein